MLALWALCCAGPARSAEDGARELRLSLALIDADARLLAGAEATARSRAGLRERIRSELGTLAIAARYAEQAGGRSDSPLGKGVADLARLFANGSAEDFHRAAARLAGAYPLDLSYFEPLGASAVRRDGGRAIYRRYCIGCHTAAAAQAGAGSAPDLFRLAQSEPRRALLARLLGGVHGDHMTGLENPFSDEEIASLAVYFLHHRSTAATR